MYELETDIGYSVKLTADHTVFTKDGWKKAKNLTRKDMLVINDHYGKDSWTARHKIYRDDSLDNEAYWMVGDYIYGRTR